MFQVKMPVTPRFPPLGQLTLEARGECFAPPLLAAPCLPSAVPAVFCIKAYHPMTSAQTCSAVDLRIRDVECHELLRESSLVCVTCSLAI